MKKMLCGILILILCMSCAAAGAADAKWDFPVSLVDIKSKYTVLVNADHLLDKSFKPDPMVKIRNMKRANSGVDYYLEETAAEALKEMFDAALSVQEYNYTTSKGKPKTATYGEKGMVLYIKSAYRSYGQQATSYENRLNKNNGKDDGYVAKPGASEHQSGLCVDILNADYKARPKMTQDFQWTPEAQWMKENCAEYGFILRYPNSAEDETGIQFEPWHFRYVGKSVAQYIMSEEITLEEFTKRADKAYNAYISAGGDPDELYEAETEKLNEPFQSMQLDEYDETGDAEVSLGYY